MTLHVWLRLLEGALRLRGVRRRVLTLPDGRAISYLESGRKRKGHTFVLVHGLGSSSIVWVRVLSAMRKRHHVVAIDLPGYGRSPLPEGRDHQNVGELSHNVVQFIGRGGFGERVVLVGQSLGGWIAAKAAREDPKVVDQLVLVNTAGILYPGIEGLRTVMNLKTKKEVQEFWERMWYKVPRYYKPFWREAAANLQTSIVQKFMDSLEEEHFINEDLPHLEMPVSVVWGRADRFLPISSVDLISEALGSTRIYWIAKCGHIPALERTPEFVRILEGIARSEGSARPSSPSSGRVRAPARRHRAGRARSGHETATSRARARGRRAA